MNYSKIYNKIIQKRQDTLLQEGYGEIHHIIPRSLGGSNKPENLVRLSAREHFVCHCLLAKMYPTNSEQWHKMNHALIMMKAESSGQFRYFNSHLYDYFRKNFSSVMSKIQKGSGNSQYGTRWVNDPVKQKSFKIGKNKPLPLGWNEGRKINWSDKTRRCPICASSFQGKGITCSPSCKKERNRRQEQNRAYNLFREFVDSPVNSVTQFAKIKSMTQPGLTKLFRTHIIGYKDTVVHGKTTDLRDLKKLLRACSSKEEQPTHNR